MTENKKTEKTLKVALRSLGCRMGLEQTTPNWGFAVKFPKMLSGAKLLDALRAQGWEAQGNDLWPDADGTYFACRDGIGAGINCAAGVVDLSSM